MMKYAIIQIDTSKDDGQILCVFNKYKDALEAIYRIINEKKEYDDERFYRKEIDKNNTISIYQLFYVQKKALVVKYAIRSYLDSDMTDEDGEVIFLN